MLDFDAKRDATPPRDAATVILLRQPGDAPFEVFFVKRSAASQFMGGAYVFPGGKLDAQDSSEEVRQLVASDEREHAIRALHEDIDAASALGLYVAAIRETFEEAGILFADVATGTDLSQLRQRILGGEAFVNVMRDAAATLNVAALVPHARWVTPRAETRRFDARFFIALVPDGQNAAHDAHETTESAWLSPNEALTRAERGDIALPPPTLRTLELLAEHRNAASALQESASRTPPYVWPVFTDEGGLFTLLLPGDPAHPERVRALPGPTRFVLDNGRWRSA